MNWLSHTTGSQPKDAVELASPDVDMPPEAVAAFEAAKAAALALVPFVGDGNDPVVVTIAGYSYAGHAPDGEPNEVITIHVGARPEDRPPEPVEEAPAAAPSVDMPPTANADDPDPEPETDPDPAAAE